MGPLTATFLARWPPSTEPPGDGALEQALEAAHASASARWQDVAVAEDVFVAYLADRADTRLEPRAALQKLQVNDLFLACACMGRSRAAEAALEAQFLARIPDFAASVDPSRAFGEEVLSILRRRLLVGGRDDEGRDDEDGGHEDGDVREQEQPREPPVPRLLQYRGWGPLQGWLAIAAKRTAISLKRGASRDSQPLDERLAVAAEDDPELEHLRARYLGELRPLVKEAVRAALKKLKAHERNLLRWHIVENHSMRKIAAVRGVDVATISRTFARVRAGLWAHVRKTLQEKSGLPTADLEAVLAALGSRISVSIGVILRKK